ncbi:MAG: VWA domain-containing protein [Acidobacteriota bacterium]
MLLSHRSLRLSVLTLAWFLLSAVPGTAQDDATQEAAAAPSAPQAQPLPDVEGDEIFFDSVDVNVVNVEVFVTDSDGQPVTGLQPENFRLFEDGEPVEITNFLAVDGPVRNATITPAQIETAEPLEERLPEQEVIPADQRLHVIVFVDNLNIQPQYRNQVLKRLRRFLRDSLDNQDRVMLVAFDGRLQILQDFTSIPELIQPGLEQLETTSTRGFEVIQERRTLLRDLSEIEFRTAFATQEQGPAESRAILEAIRVYATGIQERVRLTTSALNTLIESMAGLPGRKAMLYVSGGLEARPGTDLFEAWTQKFTTNGIEGNITSAQTEALSFDTGPELQRVVDNANANRVILYTIDASGPVQFGSLDPSGGNFDFASIATSGGGRVWTSEIDSVATTNLRSSFQHMSGSTGGLAFINTEGLGNTLSQLATDFESYYSLGYRPDVKGDGELRELDVELDGVRARIRHRTAYRDKSPEQRMSDRTLSALLLDTSDNALGIQVERAAGQLAKFEAKEGETRAERRARRRAAREAKKDNIFEVPVLVKVPLSELALLPGDDHHQGRISVFIALRDETGAMSPVQHIPLPIKIPNNRYQQAISQFAGYEFKVMMREGFQYMAVGVRDDVASTSSTVRLNFRVGG